MPIEAYWRAYLERTAPETRPAGYSAWSFGDAPAMADELAALVLAGVKRATTSLLWVYEADPDEAMPAVGQHSIVLGGRGQPLCIIETTSVVTCPFDAVNAAFAAREGEGDGSLAYWRRVHWDFFSRECAALGRTPTGSMPVVCESFRVVHT